MDALTLLIGIVLGLFVAGVMVVMLLPRLMIVVRRSKLGFDETVEALRQGVPEAGWSMPGEIDLNASMAKHGVDFSPRVRIVQMCKAPYAKEVLTVDRRVSCLMPCAVAVWQGDDGGVYVSMMNTGLMGRLFGGVVGRVMGGPVTTETRRILGPIVAD